MQQQIAESRRRSRVASHDRRRTASDLAVGEVPPAATSGDQPRFFQWSIIWASDLGVNRLVSMSAASRSCFSSRS